MERRRKDKIDKLSGTDRRRTPTGGMHSRRGHPNCNRMIPRNLDGIDHQRPQEAEAPTSEGCSTNDNSYWIHQYPKQPL